MSDSVLNMYKVTKQFKRARTNHDRKSLSRRRHHRFFVKKTLGVMPGQEKRPLVEQA